MINCIKCGCDVTNKHSLINGLCDDCSSKEELEDLSDGELIHLANQRGMEDNITKDCEGGLFNREEIIKAIKEQEE